MVDIFNTKHSDNKPTLRDGSFGQTRGVNANPLFLTEQELRQGIEMLYFAYRDFVAEPDELLAAKNLGRAHHRVIYFIGQNPQLTVSDLLAILKITKQSLNRVLNDLLNEGYVQQTTGTEDRRQRLLSLTPKGQAFEIDLTNAQMARFAKAYKRVGAQAVDGFRQVLLAIMEREEDRQRFLAKLAAQP